MSFTLRHMMRPPATPKPAEVAAEQRRQRLLKARLDAFVQPPNAMPEDAAAAAK